MEERNKPKLKDLERVIKQLAYDMQFVKECIWNIGQYLECLTEGVNEGSKDSYYQVIKNIPWNINQKWED